MLEVWSDGDNLMDQILHADDTEFAELRLDDLVVGQGDALLVNLGFRKSEFMFGSRFHMSVGNTYLSISALVYEVPNSLD